MPPRVQPRRYEPRPRARVDTGTRALEDCGDAFVPALDWLGGAGADPRGNAERRAEDLLRQNAGLLRDLHVDARVVRERGEPGLQMRTGTRLGAVPLLSPVTGRPDFGLVVSPRFPWSGVGDLLAATGFRCLPELLPLPELPQSERRVPPWVLASVVLARIERLLDATQRRFVVVEADLSAPRGDVRWERYAERLGRGRALSVPCRFPDLRDDEEIRSAAHWTVRHHRAALLSHAAHGRVVRELLSLCDRLLARLAGAPPAPPSPGVRAAWSRRPFAPAAFREGVQAIDWTVDERGLAGLADLAGLAWRIDMETFFEAWVEALSAAAAARHGAAVRAGRAETTRVPIDWSPPWSGSQRSLLPDVVVVREDVVVVLDAKYKQHADQIERLGWHGLDDRLRDAHRADLLQVLAYAGLYDAPRVVAALVYPCGVERWARLNAEGRAVRRARVRTSAKALEVALVACPLGGPMEGPVEAIGRLIAAGVGA